MKRRDFIGKSLLIYPLLATPKILLADSIEKSISPNAMSLEKAIDTLTDELPLDSIEESKRIEFIIPEIAENGAVIPVKIKVNKTTTTKELAVKSIHLFSTQESNSRCIEVFYLKPSMEKVIFATRIKLTTSQIVIVLVGLVDGSFIKKTARSKLVIHSCGGKTFVL